MTLFIYRRLFFSFLVIWSTALAFGEDRRVSIGVITALTGPLATIGSAVKNGIELARVERPDLFEKLQFYYEDDQLAAKQSIVAYNKLRAQNKISIVFGFGTVLAQAIGPLVERDRLPLINFNFEAEPAVGKSMLVRAMNHTDQYMAAMAQHFRRENVSSFSYMVAEATFFRAMVASFKRALVSSGTSSTELRELATVDPKELDFRSIILKLKALPRGPIGVFLFPEQLLAFGRQAKEMHVDARIFGTDLCETAASLPQGAELLSGCLYPDNEASLWFRARYRARYGNEAQLTFAGSAYDMTILVGELLSARARFDVDAFLHDLALVKDHSGVLGNFSYRQTDREGKFFEYPVHVKKIVQGKGVAE